MSDEKISKSMSIEVINYEFLKDFFNVLGPEVASRAAASALYRSGEAIATKSRQEYVPIDTGALKSSIHVEPAKLEGSVVTVSIVAGGASAGYALWVHEINKNYRNGKQWKYLETPAKLASMDIIEELEQSLLDELLKIKR